MAYTSGLSLLPLALQFIAWIVVAIILINGYSVLIGTLKEIKLAIQSLRLEIKEARKSFNR